MMDLGKLKFKPEEKEQLIKDIQVFFDEERDETIGIIAAEKVLDFFIDVMGNNVYNKALDDVQFWFKRYMGNMESDYYSLYKSDVKRRN